MLSIKKNDVVYVMVGKDKGKTGKILQVFSSDEKVLVEGLNLVKKSVRKSQANPNGGFLDIEQPIHVSNVMLFDKKINKPTRYSVRLLKDGTKVRISKKSGEVI